MITPLLFSWFKQWNNLFYFFLLESQSHELPISTEHGFSTTISIFSISQVDKLRGCWNNYTATMVTVKLLDFYFYFYLINCFVFELMNPFYILLLFHYLSTFIHNLTVCTNLYTDFTLFSFIINDSKPYFQLFIVEIFSCTLLVVVFFIAYPWLTFN